MIRVARRAATALLIGSALVLTLAFSAPAGAAIAPDETATTATPTTATTRPVVTTTTALPVTSTTVIAAPPVTSRQIVLIGTAESVQSNTAIQGANVVPVNAGARTERTLPATGSSSLPLALAGFALVLVGTIAMRVQQPRLIAASVNARRPPTREQRR